MEFHGEKFLSEKIIQWCRKVWSFASKTKGNDLCGERWIFDNSNTRANYAFKHSLMWESNSFWLFNSGCCSTLSDNQMMDFAIEINWMKVKKTCSQSLFRGVLRFLKVSSFISPRFWAASCQPMPFISIHSDQQTTTLVFETVVKKTLINCMLI